MPTPSQRLGLLKPSEADPFVTDDIADNWQKVDDHPGVYVCTSSNRPDWDAGNAGQLIFETDTGLIWRWTGTAWARTGPSGRLRTAAGGFATAVRGSPFTTSSQASYVVALSLANVVVPAGSRPIVLRTTWTTVSVSAGSFFMGIVRSATPGSPAIGDVTRIADGSGGTIVAEEVGLAAGNYTFTVQARAAAGGSVTIGGLTLSATEA